VFLTKSVPYYPENSSETIVILEVIGARFILKLSDFFHNIPGPKLRYPGAKNAEVFTFGVFL